MRILDQNTDPEKIAAGSARLNTRSLIPSELIEPFPRTTKIGKNQEYKPQRLV
jgi:hypothetical protein